MTSSTDGALRRDVTLAELDEPLVAYQDAVGRVEATFVPLPPTSLPLAEAFGAVLAEDVVATDDVPTFDNSAMDGFAVRSADVARSGAVLAVAQDPDAGIDRPGVAAKVMTGQPIPDGADAVVPWERTTRLDEATVRVDSAVPTGQFVRPRGEDLTAGTTALRAGVRVGAVETGVLATLGHAAVLVHPPPRVGVLSSGDELVDVSAPVGRGLVRDANGPLLAAACTAYGAVVGDPVRCPDDPQRIAEALHRLARSSDLIVTSGGASVGEKDWLREVLRREGSLDFWRVAMRPGKPVALGHVGGVPVIVLPGNPGSVLACAHVFVGRAVRRLAGRPAAPTTVPGVLGSDLGGDAERTVVHPVTLDGDVARPVPGRSSQVLSNAIGMHGWVVVPVGGLAEGSPVDVELGA